MGESDAIDRTGARDIERAARTIAGQLEERGVRLYGGETPEQLADLLTDVQRFEAAVAALGGDSMRNTPDSSLPEDPRFVIPTRKDDESVTHYAARVNAAAQRLFEMLEGRPPVDQP